jgi:hypothetical protein
MEHESLQNQAENSTSHPSRNLLVNLLFPLFATGYSAIATKKVMAPVNDIISDACLANKAPKQLEMLDTFRVNRFHYRADRNAAIGMTGGKVAAGVFSSTAIWNPAMFDKTISLNHWDGFSPDYNLAAISGINDLDGMAMLGFLVWVVWPMLIRGTVGGLTYKWDSSSSSEQFEKLAEVSQENLKFRGKFCAAVQYGIFGRSLNLAEKLKAVSQKNHSESTSTLPSSATNSGSRLPTVA